MGMMVIGSLVKTLAPIYTARLREKWQQRLAHAIFNESDRIKVSDTYAKIDDLILLEMRFFSTVNGWSYQSPTIRDD